MLGYRGDIPELLRATDIFVLASHRECTPRSIFEAMMSGLAVVSTDVRGSQEEVLHGGTGFLVPVKDSGALVQSLSKIVDSKKLQRSMGAAVRKRAVALYDEKKVIDRQLETLGLQLAIKRFH